MDANTPILIRCLQNPVVAADEVAAGHEVPSGALPLQHRPVLRSSLDRQVHQVLPNLVEWPQNGVDVVDGFGILVC